MPLACCTCDEDQLAQEQQARRFPEASMYLQGRSTELFCDLFLATDCPVGLSVFLCSMVMEVL